MMKSRRPVVCLAIAFCACTSPSIALADASHAAVKVVGTAAAGKSLFVSTCGTCHTFKAAKTAGTIGPNLTTAAAPLTESKIIDAITNGGAAIMTKAQIAKYPTRMAAYKRTLSTKQIDNIAAFLYTSLHPANK